MKAFSEGVLQSFHNILEANFWKYLRKTKVTP